MLLQYDFPSELLLAIFGKVESYDDLLALAATCRRFNHLSLQVFFSKHNFDPNPRTIILHSGPMIPALAMSLALRKTSLEHLTFDFGHKFNITLLPHQIRIVTRYIMNLSTIDRVTIHIVIPYFKIVPSDWEAAYVALLDTVIGKSCSNLHVRATSPPDETSLLISKTPSWFRIPGRLSEAVKKSDEVGTKHLKDCLIDTFPGFLRPFYLRLLKANAPVLTSLAFQSIFGRMTGTDWGFLITNVHLPVLKRFAMSFGDNISRDAIIKFLFKHSHLTNFEYHHIEYTPKPKGVPRGLEGVFSHLEQLTITPEHILGFMPMMDRMPCLTSVTIIIENVHMDSGVVEQALRRLSSCVKKIELTLDISSLCAGLEEAFPELVHFRSSFGKEDGFMLRCVECLHIRWGWGYMPNDSKQIPAWLKLFPEVTKLTFNSSKPGVQQLVVERDVLSSFFEQAKLACPTIESMSSSQRESQ